MYLQNDPQYDWKATNRPDGTNHERFLVTAKPTLLSVYNPNPSFVSLQLQPLLKSLVSKTCSNAVSLHLLALLQFSGLVIIVLMAAAPKIGQ